VVIGDVVRLQAALGANGIDREVTPEMAGGAKA
jgi:hypothetical protein